MKNLLKTITVVITALIITLSANAQEDKITGLYVDGVKVTEIDCYSFGEMELILPLSKLKGFDQIDIGFLRKINGVTFGGEYKHFTFSVLNNNSFQASGELYTKVKIYSKGKDFCMFNYGGDLNQPPPTIRRNDVYLSKNETAKVEYVFYIQLKTITGYQEKFEDYCSCYKKTPIFSSSNLNGYTLLLKPNTNGNEEPANEKKKGFKGLLSKTEPTIINYSLPCPVKGPKLEDLLKSQGSTGQKSVVNTNSDQNTSSNNSTNSTNTKPYTEKHKNGKMAVQGQFDANGQHEGTWKYFTEVGKVERVENYKDGIMHGEWKYFDEAGKLTKTEKYNEGELIE